MQNGLGAPWYPKEAPVHQPIDRVGLERRKRALRTLFEKYRRLRDEGRVDEAREHLRITTLYANASLEETLHLARTILRRLEELQSEPGAPQASDEPPAPRSRKRPRA